MDTFDEINILHLSDVHYGIGAYKGPTQDRHQKWIMRGILNTLADNEMVSEKWKPDVVLITGDIAFSGQAEEYKKFKECFLKPLLDILKIDISRVLICPGNHDVDRNVVKSIINDIRNAEEPYKTKCVSRIRPDKDKWPLNGVLGIEGSDERKIRNKPFNNFIKELCDDDATRLVRLVKFKEWPWVNFILLNSAWDCYNDDDCGRLRVGLDSLEELVDKTNVDKEIAVVGLHHPVGSFNERLVDGTFKVVEWLHCSERLTQKELTFEGFLTRNVDYIFSGHMHIHHNVRSIGDRAIQFISAANYSDDVSSYEFRIVKLKKDDEPDYIQFESKLSDVSPSELIPWDRKSKLSDLRRIRKYKKFKKNDRLQVDLNNQQELAKFIDGLFQKAIYKYFEKATFVQANTLTKKLIPDSENNDNNTEGGI